MTILTKLYEQKHEMLNTFECWIQVGIRQAAFPDFQNSSDRCKVPQKTVGDRQTASRDWLNAVECC